MCLKNGLQKCRPAHLHQNAKNQFGVYQKKPLHCGEKPEMRAYPETVKGVFYVMLHKIYIVIIFNLQDNKNQN